jgi:hypothetical protein
VTASVVLAFAVILPAGGVGLKKECKKAANLFQTYCLHMPL